MTSNGVKQDFIKIRGAKVHPIRNLTLRALAISNGASNLKIYGR